MTPRQLRSFNRVYVHLSELRPFAIRPNVFVQKFSLMKMC